MAFAQALQISCSVSTQMRPPNPLPVAHPSHPTLWAPPWLHTLFRWHRHTHLRPCLWLNQHTEPAVWTISCTCHCPLLRDWVRCWEKPAWGFLSVAFPAVAAHRLLLHFSAGLFKYNWWPGISCKKLWIHAKQELQKTLLFTVRLCWGWCSQQQVTFSWASGSSQYLKSKPKQTHPTQTGHNKNQASKGRTLQFFRIIHLKQEYHSAEHTRHTQTW